MQYEEMRQWRNIVEYLHPCYYKFADSDTILRRDFHFLRREYKSYRERLWSSYMLQICQFGPHPYSFYHHVRKRDIEWGWRLLPDWEAKVDFLEQVALYGKNPDDLPKPWKAKIWEKFLNQHCNLGSLPSYVLTGDCPLNFYCKTMTGALDTMSCPNKLECEHLKKYL